MIKVYHEEMIYYYQTAEHAQCATACTGSEPPTKLTRMMYAQIVINNQTNQIIKCKYQMETLVDRILKGDQQAAVMHETNILE
jgi:hypothetical protein